MEKKTQILLKLTSNWSTLFSNVPKYAAFINNLISNDSSSKFFLEVVNNGVIYIYDDFSTFKRLNRPYSKEEINKYEEKMELVLDPKKLMDSNLTISSFPKEGLDYQCEFYLDPHLRDEVIKIKKENYQSYLGNNIEFRESEKFDIVVHFKTFEGVFLHHKLICLMLKGLLNVPNDK